MNSIHAGRSKDTSVYKPVDRGEVIAPLSLDCSVHRRRVDEEVAASPRLKQIEVCRVLRTRSHSQHVRAIQTSDNRITIIVYRA